MTVDELARTANVPVRTIRDYQTLGLLLPPDRRGRVGFYDKNHVSRLQIIGRLQERGYSLAGIRDLLEALESGKNLPAVLGLEVGLALDETPVALSAAQVAKRVPGLTGAWLRQAQRSGLLHAQPDGRFIVRSPSALALVGDAVASGLSMAESLAVIADMRDRLAGLAEAVAEKFVDRIWKPAAAAGRSAELIPLLKRDRLLMVQAVASLMAHELGRALTTAAVGTPHEDDVRRAVEATQVGVVRDAG